MTQVKLIYGDQHITVTADQPFDPVGPELLRLFSVISKYKIAMEGLDKLDIDRDLSNNSIFSYVSKTNTPSRQYSQIWYFDQTPVRIEFMPVISGTFTIEELLANIAVRDVVFDLSRSFQLNKLSCKW